MKSKRTKMLEAEIGAFIKQYRRKAHAGWDPNDRSYDRELEKKIKNMRPEEFDELLRGETEEDNFRLYIGKKHYYFTSFEQARLEAEKHITESPELRIESLSETDQPDFWAYDYETNKWVPS